MDTNIDPALVKNRVPEAPSAAAEEWRYAQDAEWPSQLVSSNGQDAPENSSEEQSPGADHSVHANDTPNLEIHSSQYAPTKPKIFTRPASSDEDPAAGFSFGKAKPPALYFNPKPKQAPQASTNEVPCLSPASKKNASSGKPPHSTKMSSNTDNVEAASHQNLLAPERPPVSSNALTIPFPNVPVPASIECEPLITKPGAASLPTTAPRLNSTMHAPALSAAETLIGSESNGPRCTRSPKMSETVQQSRSPQQIHSNEHQPDKVISTSQNPMDTLLRPADEQCRVLQNTTTNPSTVLKKRRKKPSTGPSTNAATRPHVGPAYNEEELLHLLMIRHRHAQRERETFQVAQQAQEQEFQQLQNWASDLQVQLHEKERHYSEKEAQLTKFKASKAGWERKIRKLSDYVQGLTNDHNRLRDDARELQDRSSSILKEREFLVSAVQEARQNITKQNNDSVQVVNEARHGLEMREQTIKHQQLELHNLQDLLAAERERNDRLESEVSAFAGSYGQLSKQLSGHRDNIMGKITELLDKTEGFRAAAPSESQDHLKSLLEQCVVLLEKFQGAGAIKPEDFQSLNDSMHGYFEGIVRSIEACEHSTSVTEAGHQQLASTMQEQLRALSRNLTADQNLSEQMMDLREVKATLRERLQATETALREARIEVVALQRKDREQSHKIVAHETERAKPQQPVDNSHILLRLQEIDSRNRDLQRELENMQTQAASLSTQVQERTKEAVQLDERLIDTQVQLQEARHETEVVRAEKLAFEKQVLQQSEDLRTKLLKDASKELEAVKADHISQMQQLRVRKSPDDKFTQATKQCVTLRSEKDSLEKQASQLKASLDEMQKERQVETAFAVRLNARVAELKEQVTHKDNAFSKVQEELQASIANNDMKAAYIKSLQQDQEKCLQQAKEAESSTLSHDSHTSKHFKTPHPAIIGESQVGNGTQLSQPHQGSERCGHSSKPLPAIVEDSQDKHYERPMTPIDIEEDSQLITEDDLMNLFPVTPVTRTQSSKVSQISLSQSRSTCSQTGDKREPLNGHCETPRQAIPEARSKGASIIQRHAMASTQSSARSFTTPIVAPQKGDQRKRPQQELADKPRGILKGSSTVAKRGASMASIDDSKSIAPPKRRKSSIVSIGPVIEDSQSQSRLPSVRSRITSTKITRKTTKVDEQMSRRFSQELRRSTEL